MRAAAIVRTVAAASVTALLTPSAAAAATQSATVAVVVRVTYACRFPDAVSGALICNGASPVSSSSLQSGHPGYRVYRFADGHVVCAVPSSAGWTLSICPASAASTPAPAGTPAAP